MRLYFKKSHKPGLLLLLIASSLLPACAPMTKPDSRPISPEQENNYVLKSARIKTLGHAKGQLAQLEIATNDPLATTFEFMVVKVNHYQAKFYKQNSQEHAAYVSTIGKEEAAFLAVNGGFFTPSFTPDGLFYKHGKTITAPSKQPIFNAMVVINKQGRLTLGNSDTPYKDAAYAIQAGPLLIDQNQMLVSRVNQFNQFAKRTVLAESSSGQLLVISTSAMSLYTLENILYEHPEWFGVSKITTAVNLDGGRSSAIYVANHTAINGKNKVENVLLFS
ncbi:MAG: phosphodiester glycosidase family protein [Gammaproteobacteria bacterium]|nr:phosphodiester glycosidase family protein [Gammaproteobacteria bacterium]